jgi:hypothetical protein
MDLKQELLIRGIKLIDISYLAIIYSTLCITFSVGLDRIVGPFDKEQADKKSIIRLILEVWANISIIAIAAYVFRNIVELAPFPLDGVGGFSHSKVKEISGGVIFGFVLFFYQNNLRNKIQYIIDTVKQQAIKSIYNQ